MTPEKAFWLMLTMNYAKEAEHLNECEGCENCDYFMEHMNACDSCGNWFPKGATNFHEDTGETFCDRCEADIHVPSPDARAIMLPLGNTNIDKPIEMLILKARNMTSTNKIIYMTDGENIVPTNKLKPGKKQKKYPNGKT